LHEDQIGQIPTCGYGGANINQSAIALCWLREIEDELRENNMRLNSKLSVGGEIQIMGHFVDGYCAETKTIYQFHGCFYHSCKKCYDGDAYNNIVHESFLFFVHVLSVQQVFLDKRVTRLLTNGSVTIKRRVK
jgi:hypothetical protein